MYLLYENPRPLNFTITVWHYHIVDAVIHQPVKNAILKTTTDNNDCSTDRYRGTTYRITPKL